MSRGLGYGVDLGMADRVLVPLAGVVARGDHLPLFIHNDRPHRNIHRYRQLGLRHGPPHPLHCLICWIHFHSVPQQGPVNKGERIYGWCRPPARVCRGAAGTRQPRAYDTDSPPSLTVRDPSTCPA